MPKVNAALRTPAPEPEIIDVECTSLVPYGSQPPALRDQMNLAQVFATSGVFSDSQKAAQAAVKIIAGRDLGIPPTVAMTGIYMVKGRLTLSANLMAALVRRHGRYDYAVAKLTNSECKIAFFFDGAPIGESVFTQDDAKLAGVAHGDNWKKYPRNMLWARAMSNGVRWFCPDLFLGPVYTPEEIGADLATDLGEASMLLPDPDA